MVWLTEVMPWVEIMLSAISRHLQYDSARYRIFNLTGRIWLCPIHQSEQNEWEWNSWSDKCSGGDKQPKTTRISQTVSANTQWAQLLCNRSLLSKTRLDCRQKPLRKHSLKRGWSVEHNRHLPWMETRNSREKLQLDEAWKCQFLLICIMQDRKAFHEESEKKKEMTNWSSMKWQPGTGSKLSCELLQITPVQFDFDSDGFGCISGTVYFSCFWKRFFLC